MGSSRLPGKMMEDLCGVPLLTWVIERCKRASALDEIVIATTNNAEDDRLITIAQDLGAEVFRGSEKDVLSRFVVAAEQHNAEIVVRICADNPLVSPEEIDRLFEFYVMNLPDYAFNHVPRLNNNYPDGLGVEIFSKDFLKSINSVATDANYREHVTLWVWEHTDQVNIQTINCPSAYAYPDAKLDIDTPDDLMRMRTLCRHLRFDSKPAEILRWWRSLKEI
ncbi:NTP transferase domain-containing protein [candidate division KSB1 bacterium]|nr:NTP transferase domain-containing protein [candidate division KSB1 bacterium]